MAGLVWGVGTFIYCKITFAIFFSNGINITTAGILGLSLAAIIYGAAHFYAIQYGRSSARALFNDDGNGFVFGTIKYFVVACALYVVASKLIVFGFDTSFQRRYFGNDILFRFSRYSKDESFTFIAIVLVPVLLHYIVTCVGALSQIKLTKTAHQQRIHTQD